MSNWVTRGIFSAPFVPGLFANYYCNLFTCPHTFELKLIFIVFIYYCIRVSLCLVYDTYHFLLT